MATGLWVKKSIPELVAQAEDKERGLRRVLEPLNRAAFRL